MVTEFRINRQHFVRSGGETRLTSQGRTVRLGVSSSACPGCGNAVDQSHRGVGFAPTRSGTGRCPACREGLGWVAECRNRVTAKLSFGHRRRRVLTPAPAHHAAQGFVTLVWLLARVKPNKLHRALQTAPVPGALAALLPDEALAGEKLSGPRSVARRAVAAASSVVPALSSTSASVIVACRSPGAAAKVSRAACSARSIDTL
jgi:hypothetical protein